MGSVYVLFGFLFLIIPLLFVELAKPKDIFKAGLIVLLGLLLIVRSNTFELYFSTIFFLNFVILSLYIFEVYSYRWNQLLDKEKKRLVTFSDFLRNLSILWDSIKLGFKTSFAKPFSFNTNKTNLNQKKWIRSNQEKINKRSNTLSNQDESTNNSKKDIMNDEKNPIKINQIE